MKTQFEKIYVLSLITNHKRRKFIIDQFKYLDIQFEFIYGTDFYNLKYDANNKQIKYPDVHINETHDFFRQSGDYGCTLSHYNGILFAYELGYNNILIIEDDICFIKDKNLIYKCINNIPDDADYVTWDPRFIIYNDYVYYKQFINNKNIYTNITNKLGNIPMIGGMMYGIMNRKSMEIYLNNQRNSMKMSDLIGEFNVGNKYIKKYVCNKCICAEQFNLLCNFKNEKNNIINNFIHQNIYALIEPLDKSMFYDINYEDKNDYVLITH